MKKVPSANVDTSQVLALLGELHAVGKLFNIPVYEIANWPLDDFAFLVNTRQLPLIATKREYPHG